MWLTQQNTPRKKIQRAQTRCKKTKELANFVDMAMKYVELRYVFLKLRCKHGLQGLMQTMLFIQAFEWCWAGATQQISWIQENSCLHRRRWERKPFFPHLLRMFSLRLTWNPTWYFRIVLPFRLLCYILGGDFCERQKIEINSHIFLQILNKIHPD